MRSFLWVAVIAAAFSAASRGDQPTAAPTTAPAGGAARADSDLPSARPVKILVLSTLEPQPTALPSYAQIEAAYPVIKHAPVEMAGFNALTLPFLFVSKDNAGDPLEALAFSFLLSHSLDWSPGCYCARHAYFVFKRNSNKMLPLVKSYDDVVIRGLIGGWRATHAVGGTITAGKDGYSGTLVIYDINGVVHKKEFAAPREYFALLGDMTVEAMTFLDQKPSEDLSKVLHAKRCQPQSIIDLGKAAFLPERGEEEFGLYANILKRDPGFSDVRYWWANQKQWGDGDRVSYHKEIALAMDSYPVSGVFELKDDQQKYPNFPSWLEQVSKLSGKVSPLTLRLELARERPEDPAAINATGGELGPLMDRLKAAAAKYPNDYCLATDAGRATRWDIRFADADSAVALFAVAASDNYMLGSGGVFQARFGLANALEECCGRSDWAVPIAVSEAAYWKKYGESSDMGYCLLCAGQGLMQLGRYEQAAICLDRAIDSLPPSPARDSVAVPQEGVALGLSGQRDRLEAFIQKHADQGESARCLTLWKAYLDLLDGKKVDVGNLLAQPLPPSWDLNTVKVQLCSQAYYLQGDPKGRDVLTWTLRGEPENRLLWTLFDAFDRRWPEAQSAAFYDSLEWLHGDDPWVKQAVADFRKRTPKGQYKTADELLAMLRPYEPIRWPGTLRSKEMQQRDFHLLNAAPAGAFAAAIHGLLVAKDYAKAKELALRFHNLVSAGPNTIYTPMYANHIVYLVEAASPDKSLKK